MSSFCLRLCVPLCVGLLTLCSSSALAFHPWFKDFCLQDVKESLNKLSKHGRQVQIFGGNVFKGSEYTSDFENIWGAHNHFQGVVYNPINDYYVFSGGDGKTGEGALFIAHKNGDRYTVQSRMIAPGAPELWHAGGITTIRDILLVPVERLSGKKFSQIHFYKLGDKKPTLLEEAIYIPHTKTGAVDVFFYGEDVYIFGFDTKSINIFETDIEEGRFQNFKKHKEVFTKIFRGSNIKVLQECSGRNFIAEITNDGILPPLLSGTDVVSLYELDFESFKLQKVDTIDFYCGDQCSFRGAVNIQPQGGGASIISTTIYRDSKQDLISIKHFERQEIRE